MSLLSSARAGDSGSTRRAGRPGARAARPALGARVRARGRERGHRLPPRHPRRPSRASACRASPRVARGCRPSPSPPAPFRRRAPPPLQIRARAPGGGRGPRRSRTTSRRATRERPPLRASAREARGNAPRTPDASTSAPDARGNDTADRLSSHAGAGDYFTAADARFRRRLSCLQVRAIARDAGAPERTPLSRFGARRERVPFGFRSGGASRRLARVRERLESVVPSRARGRRDTMHSACSRTPEREPEIQLFLPAPPRAPEKPRPRPARAPLAPLATSRVVSRSARVRRSPRARARSPVSCPIARFAGVFPMSDSTPGAGDARGRPPGVPFLAHPVSPSATAARSSSLAVARRGREGDRSSLRITSALVAAARLHPGVVSRPPSL